MLKVKCRPVRADGWRGEIFTSMSSSVIDLQLLLHAAPSPYSSTPSPAPPTPSPAPTPHAPIIADPLFPSPSSCCVDMVDVDVVDAVNVAKAIQTQTVTITVGAEVEIVSISFIEGTERVIEEIRAVEKERNEKTETDVTPNTEINTEAETETPLESTRHIEVVTEVLHESQISAIAIERAEANPSIILTTEEKVVEEKRD